MSYTTELCTNPSHGDGCGLYKEHCLHCNPVSCKPETLYNKIKPSLEANAPVSRDTNVDWPEVGSDPEDKVSEALGANRIRYLATVANPLVFQHPPASLDSTAVIREALYRIATWSCHNPSRYISIGDAKSLAETALRLLDVSTECSHDNCDILEAGDEVRETLWCTDCGAISRPDEEFVSPTKRLI